MKSLFSLIAVVIIFGMQPVFATNVSGTISTDSTWNIAGSPYIITNNLTINHGVTLTIDSGVVVKFDDYQNLYVNGKLKADTVVFTSNNASPTPGIWNAIQVGDGTISDSGNVILNSCQIQYANQLYIYNGKATLTNTDLTNISNYGVHLEAMGTLIMTGGNINGNGSWATSYGSGIYASQNSHSTLSGVNIQHFQNGVSLFNKSSVNISNINITSCNWPIIYNASANLMVSGTNSFLGNTNSVVYMYFSSFSDTLTLPVINIPYYFPYGMTINNGALMVIGSNNILKFNYYSLDVQGSLKAIAKPGENIYFTSYLDDNWGGDSNNDGTTTAPSSGNWYGIQFEDQSNDANCVMRRCQVRYAGYGNTGGINMTNASPTIDSCNLSNNYFGVYMLYASNPVLTNNTIGSSQMTPIAMSFEANPTMSNNVLSFSDNTYDAIGLIGNTLTANATITTRSFTNVQNITYLLLNQVTIPSSIKLTINKGVVIKSYSYYQQIIVNGTLIANASADSMITFTSAKDDNFGKPGDTNKDGTLTSPAIGDWGGILFNPGSAGTLNYCRIKYGAIQYYNNFTNCSTTEYLNDAGVAMIDASPTISNCDFENLDYGISCYRASNPTISNDSMINIKYTPICISGSSNPTFSGITFTNVGWRAIGLLGGNVCENGTIKKRDMAGYSNISYVLLSDMTINSGTNVNVEPGVVIKMNNTYNGTNIFVDGGFKTDGTSSQHVVFTSIKDDNQGNPGDSNGDGNGSTPAAGDWGSIKFRSTSDDAYCLLNYTIINYAGNTSEGGVTFENAGGQLKNSNITNSLNYGVYSNGNSTPNIDSVTIQNCNLDPIAISLTSNPTLNNITFVSNKSQAIKIIEGTLSSDANLISRDVAGITNIAYIISNLTISSNAKLTIQPGVVIKFRGDNYCQSPRIDVNGNLIANGTASNKIYFTSYADDSKGGDSNNNGNTTFPAKGDWGAWDCYNNYGGIRFLNNSYDADTVNSLRNCEISYAGSGLYIANSHVTIDSCLIQLSSFFGASVIGSANPDFKNCQFYNITYSPIELSMFSKPTFSNCTALNVGIMALSVYPETYSQTDTVPVRNFAGYNNISYFMEGNCTINSGTTITIPAGIVFKSTTGSYFYYNYTNNIANGFIVNGRLNIMGTSINPVVFTNVADDNYGNPKDMNQDGSATHPPDGINQLWSGNWIAFNDVSDDSSTINNAIFKYGSIGITTLSASPTIRHTRFENLNYGVDMNGVSSPKIDTCIFNNLQYYPIQISLVSYPASSSNNIISGTTYKIIKVRDETLTQDETLPKRSFGGVNNIAYLFGNYTVGTGATLTIKPGVVCKFIPNYYNCYYGYNYSYLDVFKGLNAQGGSTPDSLIVFTSLIDDFYGGDSNSDSTATIATIGDCNSIWAGLIFEDELLDPLCKLKNCIIRFANKGIQTISASPTVSNCNINNNNYGVYATAASNPSFSNCDFKNNYYFSIDNVDKSFTINAKNCWWGSNLGPLHSNTQGNGTSEQEIVTDSVDYTPWITIAGNPLMGDVSLNGVVTAYDASLVLQYSVSNITLTPEQQQVADVSATGGITAYDASLILQYTVGLIQSFPAEMLKAAYSVPLISNATLTIGSANAIAGQEVTIPISAANISGMTATNIQLHFDPVYIQAAGVENLVSDMNMAYSLDNQNGIISIAMAGVNPLSNNKTLVNVKFIAQASGSATVATNVTVKKFLADETDFTTLAIPGTILIGNNTTGIATTESKQQGMDPVYPNPSSGNATLVYHLNDDSQSINIEVYGLLGQKVACLLNAVQNKGTYSIPVTNSKLLGIGTYFIRMTTNNFSQTQMLQIVK